MKKILFLYNRHSGYSVTGGQKYEEDLFNGLLENKSFSIERICINDITSFVSKILSPLRNLRLLKQLELYDLIIFNSVEGYYLLLLGLILRFIKRKQIAIIHHHFMYMSFNGIKRGLYYLLESLFLKSADIIITPSPYIKALCRQRFPNKGLRFWPIPFSKAINQISINPMKGELLYIGTIEPRKGLIYLMDALAYLVKRGKHYHLTVIGKVVDNLYMKRLIKQIDFFNLNVSFTGFISSEEKNAIVAKSDVFVFPSQLEGYGMVLCEAMYEGLPVICFDNSAMPFTVKNNYNGIIIPNKDVVAYAKAIESVVENRNLRSRLSAGAIAYTKELITPQSFKDLTNKEICAIISGKRKSLQ